MRFAGSAPITDFLNKSVDMGSVAQKAAESRSQLKNAGTQLQGQVGVLKDICRAPAGALQISLVQQEYLQLTHKAMQQS